jgi:FtsP/CotA-like multicopper oxidase with cupredoxin domain
MKGMNHSKMGGRKRARQNGDMKGMDHSMMEMGNQTDIPKLFDAKITYQTMLPAENPTREMYFELTGNMNRYVWSMDGKVISGSKIWSEMKPQNCDSNASMMRHPMHLHGHDFRVINGQGEYAPMMNVIDIMPMDRCH